MISILIGAVGLGLMAGMPLSDIIGSVNEGIGNTLKGIALPVSYTHLDVYKRQARGFEGAEPKEK